MSKIQYPMSTAVIFGDVIFPVQFENQSQIRPEIEKAITGLSSFCNVELMVVKAEMLVSCWGRYLTYKQIMAEAL